MFLNRIDIELNADEKKYISRSLISNTEIEFSEFVYDLKIYQVQMIESKDVIAYQIDIFTFSDPDTIYRFNYPMNYTPETNDPHSLVFDIFNLVEHPLKHQKEEKKSKKYQPTDETNNTKTQGNQSQ